MSPDTIIAIIAYGAVKKLWKKDYRLRLDLPTAGSNRFKIIFVGIDTDQTCSRLEFKGKQTRLL